MIQQKIPSLLRSLFSTIHLMTEQEIRALVGTSEVRALQTAPRRGTGQQAMERHSAAVVTETKRVSSEISYTCYLVDGSKLCKIYSHQTF